MLFLCLIATVAACNEKESKFSHYKQGSIILPSGKNLKVYLAITPQEQTLGLSKTMPEEFKDDETMLFFDLESSMRQFWMPETFFDLDIVFLTKDLYVLDVHRGLKHYKKRTPRHMVPLSKKVYCRHVLEIKASSPFASEIKPGMMLKWSSEPSLSKIESDIRQQQ